MQSNTVEDRPFTTPTPAEGGNSASAVATPAVKRYDSPPAMTIDPSKSYQATIKTTKGNIQLQLDAKAAPQTVNSFVFLAREGYYNNTPFMQVAASADDAEIRADSA